ncbi:MAG: TrbG/VirB9 family P-type conjugative transfer protein [Bdellovibrionales bacterium]|nr:TrbG/VirB9 family P-type conjugative transfer protein [Bdellovibrionales bacterium]
MKILARLFLILLYGQSLFAQEKTNPPFPVFLKQGFSSVLEFDESPIKVVIGDTQSFQVEKLDKSLVLKCLTPYATTNLFVYFKTRDPRVFLVTASEDAEPTYYKKFTDIKPAEEKKTQQSARMNSSRRDLKITSKEFSPKKDYLTVNFEVSANSENTIRPNWNLIRLTLGKQIVAPSKLWSARREVQKDSTVKARLIFSKPNLSAGLKGVMLIVPLIGEGTPMKASL